MALVIGLLVLLVGVAIVWGGAPDRLPWPVPWRAMRIFGLLVIAVSARWFLAAGDVFVGLVQFAVGFSLVGTSVALGAPLYPRGAVLATCGAAVLAVVLEVVR